MALIVFNETVISLSCFNLRVKISFKVKRIEILNQLNIKVFVKCIPKLANFKKSFCQISRKVKNSQRV